MTVVFGALKAMNGVGFAREVLNYLEANGVKGKTFNGVNATLAALASKGYVEKSKAIFNEKLYTKYTIIKELVAEAEAEAEAVANAE